MQVLGVNLRFPPLSRMLYGSMLEASSREVKLEDTHPGAFKALVRYMYSGTVDELDVQVSKF